MAGKLGIARYEAHNGLTVSFGADVEPNQAVKVSADKTVTPAGAADVVVGTVIKAGKSGEKGTIRLRGDVIPMVASGAVAAGDKIAAAAGKAKKDAGTDSVFGVALTSGADAAEVQVIVL